MTKNIGKRQEKQKPKLDNLDLPGASSASELTCPVRLLLPFTSSQVEPEFRESYQPSLFKVNIFLLPGKPQTTSPAAVLPLHLWRSKG